MTREKVISSATKGDRQQSESFKGIGLADILLLPEHLQPLASWMLRQRETVDLDQVIAFLNQPEADAREALNYLVQHSFIQPLTVNGETRYQLRLAQKRGRELPEVIWQTLAPGSPLAVIRNPSGEQVVVAGETADLSVTVINQGNQSALIDIGIDETSQPYLWCESPRDRLALGPQQSGEVLFHIQVPPQTMPRVYNYALVIDAPEHYPEDTPMRYTQVLQVQPPVQKAVRVNDPTFAIQPATSSAKPAILQPSQVMEVQVLVHNTSDRVDRFRLTCPDLEEAWFTVRYPEGLDTPGLVLETSRLDLNPGARGQILLLIHPPLGATAGIYSPTVQLHSANNPDLALLDLVYLQVQPINSLSLELRTLMGKVRRGAGNYEIRLNNDGNTEREVLLFAGSPDEDKLCDYELVPSQIWVLPPKTSDVATLRVKPKTWWRRPLFGSGKLITFFVEAEDQRQVPLPGDRLEGALVWEARPVWQFLLFALTTLGAVALLAWLIWSAFTKTPPTAKILEFAVEGATYQEGEDSIRLNWQVRNPDKVGQLKLTSQSQDGTASGQPLVFDFGQKKLGDELPKELQPFCGKVLQPILECKSVPTDARKAGSYVFELAVIPREGQGEASEVKKTGMIAIVPQLPAIASFTINGKEFATQDDSKYLVALNKREAIKKLVITWKVQGKNLKVELLPSPGTVKPEGEIVHRLTQRPVAETFVLKVTNASGQEVSRSVTIETFDPSAPKDGTTPSALGKLPQPGALPTVPIPGSPGGALPPPPGGAGQAPGSPGGAPGGSPGGAPGSASGGSASGKPGSKNPSAPTPTEPGTLSPSELPPQFN